MPSFEGATGPMTGQRAGMFILFLLILQNFWVSSVQYNTLSATGMPYVRERVSFRIIMQQKIMCLVKFMELCQGHMLYRILKWVRSYVFQDHADSEWWILDNLQQTFLIMKKKKSRSEDWCDGLSNGMRCYCRDPGHTGHVWHCRRSSCH